MVVLRTKNKLVLETSVHLRKQLQAYVSPEVVPVLRRRPLPVKGHLFSRWFAVVYLYVMPQLPLCVTSFPADELAQGQRPSLQREKIREIVRTIEDACFRFATRLHPNRTFETGNRNYEGQTFPF